MPVPRPRWPAPARWPACSSAERASASAPSAVGAFLLQLGQAAPRRRRFGRRGRWRAPPARAPGRWPPRPACWPASRCGGGLVQGGARAWRARPRSGPLSAVSDFSRCSAAATAAASSVARASAPWPVRRRSRPLVISSWRLGQGCCRACSSWPCSAVSCCSAARRLPASARPTRSLAGLRWRCRAPGCGLGRGAGLLRLAQLGLRRSRRCVSAARSPGCLALRRERRLQLLHTCCATGACSALSAGRLAEPIAARRAPSPSPRSPRAAARRSAICVALGQVDDPAHVPLPAFPIATELRGRNRSGGRLRSAPSVDRTAGAGRSAPAQPGELRLAGRRAAAQRPLGHEGEAGEADREADGARQEQILEHADRFAPSSAPAPARPRHRSLARRPGRSPRSRRPRRRRRGSGRSSSCRWPCRAGASARRSGSPPWSPAAPCRSRRRPTPAAVPPPPSAACPAAGRGQRSRDRDRKAEQRRPLVAPQARHQPAGQRSPRRSRRPSAGGGPDPTGSRSARRASSK